jgi:hypothetical protein
MTRPIFQGSDRGAAPEAGRPAKRAPRDGGGDGAPLRAPPPQTPPIFQGSGSALREADAARAGQQTLPSGRRGGDCQHGRQPPPKPALRRRGLRRGAADPTYDGVDISGKRQRAADGRTNRPAPPRRRRRCIDCGPAKPDPDGPRCGSHAGTSRRRRAPARSALGARAAHRPGGLGRRPTRGRTRHAPSVDRDESAGQGRYQPRRPARKSLVIEAFCDPVGASGHHRHRPTMGGRHDALRRARRLPYASDVTRSPVPRRAGRGRRLPACNRCHQTGKRRSGAGRLRALAHRSAEDSPSRRLVRRGPSRRRSQAPPTTTFLRLGIVAPWSCQTA